MWLGTFQGEASPVPWPLRSALADLGDEAAGQGTAGPAWVACQHCVHVSPARSACLPQAVWPQTSWAPATPRAWPLPPARPAPAASASPRVMTGPAGLSRPARCPGGVLAAGVPPWARPTAPQQQTAYAGCVGTTRQHLWVPRPWVAPAPSARGAPVQGTSQPAASAAFSTCLGSAAQDTILSRTGTFLVDILLPADSCLLIHRSGVTVPGAGAAGNGGWGHGLTKLGDTETGVAVAPSSAVPLRPSSLAGEAPSHCVSGRSGDLGLRALPPRAS